MARSPMNNARPKAFETSLEELERIVRELEQGKLTLEQSLELFEQGVKLSRECQERLNQAERRIDLALDLVRHLRVLVEECLGVAAALPEADIFANGVKPQASCKR